MIEILSNPSPLAHLLPLAFFYTSWKYQKTKGFLLFSRSIEKDHDMKWVRLHLVIITANRDLIGYN